MKSPWKFLAQLTSWRPSAKAQESSIGNDTNWLCASSSAKLGGHACWSCGLTECEFLVLSQVVHVDVAIGLHPVFVGFDGEGADEA
ncbi:hypothetical protein GOA59_18155 [Sinorhizobium meliloti]|nr:hypothetical protein [Sinorhizobium meliloti]MDW9607036.1 hypothetical protein [Sinorhizobium meliloti]MDW9674741.1 hypothetical protein [Sinorhizobium meliloti]MDW9953625.1 hypothetical protein [Sinorhizobium meliloti]MDX0388401.1 hypothetical protein [Sinorhizobium meliloti]